MKKRRKWVLRHLRYQSNFCCLLLPVFKSHYLKNLQWNRFTFFANWKETNMLYVIINFTGNSFLGIGRYCGKVVPEPSDCHLFWTPALRNNVLSITFSLWHLVNDSRNKTVSAFLLCFIGFGKINFYIFFIKISCFGLNLFF